MQKAPGLYFNLGGMPKGKDPKTTPSHHTPDFYLDESGFKLGVKTLLNLVLDYMAMGKNKARLKAGRLNDCLPYENLSYRGNSGLTINYFFAESLFSTTFFKESLFLSILSIAESALV